MKTLHMLILSSLLLTRAISAGNFNYQEGEALGEDDQCSWNDEECALSALQTRGERMTLQEGYESETSTSGRRRSNKIQTEDLTVEWEKKLNKLIAKVGQNITAAEWKAYYMGLDLRSLNMSMFEIDNRTIGVNGTEVNWMRHPNWWMPFEPSTGEPTALNLLENDVAASIAEEFPDDSMLIVPRPAFPLGSAGFIEETQAPVDSDNLLEESVETVSSAGRRRHGDPLAKVPPRTKRTQQYMTMTQGRIDRVWDAITGLTNTIDWMNNFMGSHHRLWHGKAVLLADSADLSWDWPWAQHELSDAVSQEAGNTDRHHPKKKLTEDFGDQKFQWGRPPQEPILDQIKETKEQIKKLWDHFGIKARVIEALKRRVAIYRRAAMSLMEERIQRVDSIDPVAAENSHTGWEEGSFVDINLLEEAVTVSAVGRSDDWLVAGETIEKCCKCASKAFGYSATGKCSFCKEVVALVSVDAKCTKGAANFQGTQTCADMCVGKV